MLNLSDEQLRVLRHMLGINKPREAAPIPYRDRYCAPVGDPALEALVAAGAVERYAEEGGYSWYRTTPAGREAAIASHRAIRWRKPARVYARYLAIRDALSDLSFKRFLTDPQFADERRAA